MLTRRRETPTTLRAARSLARADSAFGAPSIACSKPPAPQASRRTARCRAARGAGARAAIDTPPASRHSLDSSSRSANETNRWDKNRASLDRRKTTPRPSPAPPRPAQWPRKTRATMTRRFSAVRMVIHRAWFKSKGFEMPREVSRVERNIEQG